MICFLQWFDRHDQVCKIEPMEALVATTCDALQQALCKIYDRGAIRTTCRTSRPMSKTAAACSRVRSNGSPGFRTPVRSTSTRTARRAPIFGHGPAMTLGKARRTPHCELRRHAGRRVRRSSLRDQVLVRAELGRAEPRPHRPPRHDRAGRLTITLRNNPPVLAMSRASASGTEPTREAILAEFRAKWEIVRRHRQD